MLEELLVEASKDMKKIIKKAVKAGWKVSVRKGGHIVFYPTDKTKDQIVAGSTESDVRAIKNTKARLRKAGLDI